MSVDYPNRKTWLATRATPKRLSARLLWNSGTQGTFVRPTGDPKRDAELQRFQRTCNGNFARKLNIKKSADHKPQERI